MTNAVNGLKWKEGINMNPATIIAIIALGLILFLAIRHIVKAKRRGVKCIGCPIAGSCSKKEIS